MTIVSFDRRSMNGSNFATPDNSGSVFPASPAANYQVSNTEDEFPYMQLSCVQEGDGGDPCVAPLATWVTVWGFPPSAASFILQQVSCIWVSSDSNAFLQFGACGTVLQHVMPPNSNWMHIRFQTR